MPEQSAFWNDYLLTRSEGAFAAVVKETMSVVYSAALRKSFGDSHLATEITQTVFIDLAANPQVVPHDAVLAGWLYRHACFKASQAMRAEMRRRSREQNAAEVQAMNRASADPWEIISPLLDDLMQKLKASDRNALVLRFFQDADLKAVGAALRISEDAAQKKVSRALKTLHGLFMQRGITISIAGFIAAVQANSNARIPGQFATLANIIIPSAPPSAIPFITLPKILTMKTTAAVFNLSLLVAGLSLICLKDRHAFSGLRATFDAQTSRLKIQSDALQKERDLTLILA